ncbi:hypothetical protein [Thiobacillus sp.]|uniref:hypothetical protein n=1 Tax=Thiobacillus sp. TaxID=924 RepID=UPI0025EB86FA|nr:hypothetical protein [Thiobacillus sp.]MBT9539419.1 hypothetical protein [Thiobacillus sp.]
MIFAIRFNRPGSVGAMARRGLAADYSRSHATAPAALLLSYATGTLLGNFPILLLATAEI